MLCLLTLKDQHLLLCLFLLFINSILIFFWLILIFFITWWPFFYLSWFFLRFSMSIVFLIFSFIVVKSLTVNTLSFWNGCVNVFIISVSVSVVNRWIIIMCILANPFVRNVWFIGLIIIRDVTFIVQVCLHFFT